MDAFIDHEESIRELPGLRLAMRKDGVLHAVVGDGAHITKAYMDAAIAAMHELAGPRAPCLLLLDQSAPHETAAEARDFATSPEVHAVMRKLALVVRTPVARVIGNAFLFTRRPPFPMRLFTTEDDAVRWLQEDG